jgi:hypothetical protein
LTQSVREWWKDTFNGQFKGLSDTKGNASDQGPGFAQTLLTGSENRHTLSPRAQSPAGTSSCNGPDPDEVEQDAMDRFDSLAATATHSSRSHTNDAALPVRTVQLEDIPSQLEVPGQPSTPSVQRDFVQLSDGSPSSKEQVAYQAIQHLFSRASHLIRESSELHGIIFVAASLQDIAITENRRKSVAAPANTPRFGDLRHPAMIHKRGLSIGTKNNSWVTTESTGLPAFIRQGFKAHVEAPAAGGKDKVSICKLLGYSLNNDSGRGDAAPSSRHLEVPQSTLRDLLRRYPNGHIFQFNSDGSLLDHEVMDSIGYASRSRTHSNGKTIFEKEKEQLRAYQLLHICPGARGIIFFPLWDPQRDQVSTVPSIREFFPPFLISCISRTLNADLGFLVVCWQSCLDYGPCENVAIRGRHFPCCLR